MKSLKSPRVLDHYKFAFVLTAVILAVAVYIGGGDVLLPITALALIEVTFSFENAVINSQVLSTMSIIWQRIFLTVGIAIAVFGVRLLLPLLLVAATAHHSLHHVLDIALHNPDIYAAELKQAYPIIAAFGGVFLLMIGLRFFSEKKEVVWIDRVEGPVSEFNQPWWVSIGGALVAIWFIQMFLAHGDNRVIWAGVFGALTFLAVKLAGELLVYRGRRKKGINENSQSSGFMQFIYLELLDASFSFDGVIAAFAITKEVLLISTGLGIGAMYVRSMTVHLLKRGTLAQYRYLVHGAHYAILSLSILLLASIKHEIPEVATATIGLVIIAFSLESSRRYNRSQTRV